MLQHILYANINSTRNDAAQKAALHLQIAGYAATQLNIIKCLYRVHSMAREHARCWMNEWECEHERAHENSRMNMNVYVNMNVSTKMNMNGNGHSQPPYFTAVLTALSTAAVTVL